MKKRRFYPTLLFASMLLSATAAMAQTQQVVMTTSRAAGQSLSFTVNAGTVSVDWGDGTATNVTSTGEAITGTLKGSTVKVSGDKLALLNCADCDLTAIDLSNAAKLGSLHCENNALPALSFPTGCALVALDCADNQLATLSLSRATDLVDLNCSGNQLKSLTTSYCKNLQTLFCADNEITSISITSNPKLKTLWCQNNKLTRLTISSNPLLESVITDGNAITQIKTTSMATLYDFWCNNNSVEELDLSGSTAMKTLSLEENGLSSLSLPASMANIYEFYGAGNNLGFNSMYSTIEASNYSYGPNGTFELPVSEMNVSETLDLSGEATDAAAQKITAEFAWQDANGTALAKGSGLDYRESSGKIRFNKGFPEIYCLMTSDQFPGLTLKSTPLRVIDPTGITNVTQQSGFTYSTSDGKLYMTSEKAIHVTIYTIGGQQVWSGTVSAEGKCVPLVKGLYVVNGIKVIL